VIFILVQLVRRCLRGPPAPLLDVVIGAVEPGAGEAPSASTHTQRTQQAAVWPHRPRHIARIHHCGGTRESEGERGEMETTKRFWLKMHEEVEEREDRWAVAQGSVATDQTGIGAPISGDLGDECK